MQDQESGGGDEPSRPIETASAALEAACEEWSSRGSASALGRWLARELDQDGSPKRLPVADWSDCLETLGRARGRPGLTDLIVHRIEGLFAWLLHASRPDGSPVFGPRGRDAARVRVLRDGAAAATDPAPAAVVRRWFPDPDRPAPSPAAPPLPAISDGDRVLAMLRPDWTEGGDWIGVDHRQNGSSTLLELAADGRVLLGGSWTSPGLIGPVGRAKPTSWTTGAYADALEWSFRSGPVRVTRTVVLLRYRRVALFAQQEDGPATPADLRLGLAGGTVARPIPGQRAWSLSRSRLSARLIPVGLPASDYPTDRGSFRVEGPDAVLEQPASGKRRWLPLVVTWGRSPSQWRTLTVTERSRACPPEVAFAARLGWGIGEDGLLIYRSLGPPALRAVLGLQTKARFLVGRFTPEGNVVPLLSLD